VRECVRDISSGLACPVSCLAVGGFWAISIWNSNNLFAEFGANAVMSKLNRQHEVASIYRKNSS
jgi:hypothetical protein